MNELRERLTELEIRFVHQEDFISKLNEVVIDQQKVISRLEKEILDLKRGLETDEGTLGSKNPQDHRPPHY